MRPSCDDCALIFAMVINDLTFQAHPKIVGGPSEPAFFLPNESQNKQLHAH